MKYLAESRDASYTWRGTIAASDLAIYHNLHRPGAIYCFFARLYGKRHVNTNKREGVLKTVLQNLTGGDRLHQKGPGRRSSCLQIMRLARSSELLLHVFTY